MSSTVQRRRPILALCIALATSALAAPGAAADPAPTGLSFPESVLLHEGRGFVSNLGAALDPFGKDGDGFISEIDGAGHVIEAQAFPAVSGALNSPKGLAAINGVLYTADIDRVVGFSIESGAQVFEASYAAEGPVLLNDLAATPGGELLVSDTLGGALLALSPRTGAYRLITRDIPGANGISVEQSGSAAIVVAAGAGFSGGTVYKVDLASGKASALPDAPVGVLDGVAHLPNGDLVVSDWVSVSKPTPGRVMRLSPDGRILEEALAPGVAAPADFGPLNEDGLLLVPLMTEASLLRLDFAR